MDELKEWLEEIAAWENRWKRLRRTFGKKLDKMTVGEIMKIGRTPMATLIVEARKMKKLKVIPEQNPQLYPCPYSKDTTCWMGSGCKDCAVFLQSLISSPRSH